MKSLLPFFAVIGAILLAIWISFNTEKNDNIAIRDWAGKENTQINYIERHYFTTGPYYLTEHCRIYKVNTDKGIYWFRYGMLLDDIEKE